MYFLHNQYCWRPYYPLLKFINKYEYLIRSLSLEVGWIIVHIMLIHILSWVNTIQISHHQYLPTLDHPRLVNYFKYDCTNVLTPYLGTLRTFIFTHVQPSII